ncbi:MAG: hypothetical protein FWF59_11540 [Turicibacter sp.]|nr:hypothetical protein [Turicibacter sp.]
MEEATYGWITTENISWIIGGIAASFLFLQQINKNKLEMRRINAEIRKLDKERELIGMEIVEKRRGRNG